MQMQDAQGTGGPDSLRFKGNGHLGGALVVSILKVSADALEQVIVVERGQVPFCARECTRPK